MGQISGQISAVVIDRIEPLEGRLKAMNLVRDGLRLFLVERCKVVADDKAGYPMDSLFSEFHKFLFKRYYAEVMVAHHPIRTWGAGLRIKKDVNGVWRPNPSFLQFGRTIRLLGERGVLNVTVRTDHDGKGRFYESKYSEYVYGLKGETRFGVPEADLSGVDWSSADDVTAVASHGWVDGAGN